MTMNSGFGFYFTVSMCVSQIHSILCPHDFITILPGCFIPRLYVCVCEFSSSFCNGFQLYIYIYICMRTNLLKLYAYHALCHPCSLPLYQIHTYILIISMNLFCSILFCPPFPLLLYYENVVTPRPFHSHLCLNAHCREFKCNLCSQVCFRTYIDMWNPLCSLLIYAHTCEYFPIFNPRMHIYIYITPYI